MSHVHYAAFRIYVNQLDLPWRKTQRTNFLRFGAAFLPCRSLPLRRLARALAGPGKEHAAADKRFRRFLGNQRLDEPAMDAALGCHLRFFLPRLGAMPFIPVMLDWLFVGARAILWAQIPYRGRSLPLFASVHNTRLADDEPGRTEAEAALLARLRACWPESAPPPLLLCDRGFDKGPLLSWLLSQGWLFIIRIQRGHHLYEATGRLLNPHLKLPPGPTRIFPQVTYLQKDRLPVHLVVRCQADPQSGKPKRWRLITSLPEEQLRRVPKLYAQRMQPEGTHKDCKRGHFVAGFGLSHLERLRKDRLERLLLLVSLLIGFLVLVAETERETRAWLCRRHWGLALVTFALDLLQAAGSKARQLAQRACASVQLQPTWLQSDHS